MGFQYSNSFLNFEGDIGNCWLFVVWDVDNMFFWSVRGFWVGIIFNQIELSLV